MPPTPEALARENIDAQLTAAGWLVGMVEAKAEGVTISPVAGQYSISRPNGRNKPYPDGGNLQGQLFFCLSKIVFVSGITCRLGSSHIVKQ